MQQTENYALNQWDPEDRILRTNFNADNAKIDEAIAAVRDACPMAKLVDKIISSDTAQVDLDLSAFDLTKYYELFFYFTSGTVTVGDAARQVYVRCNGLSSGYCGSDKYEWNYLMTFPLFGTDMPGAFRGQILLGSGALLGIQNSCSWTDSSDLRYTSLGDNCCTLRLSAASLRKLNFYVKEEDGLLSANSRITLYGVKK